MKKQQRQILLRSLLDDLVNIEEAEIRITNTCHVFCNGIICLPKQYASSLDRCEGCPLDPILAEVENYGGIV